MAAGDSATFEAESQRLRSVELQRLADDAREMHRRYSAAASSERRLSRTLDVLESRGYTLLADRRWPNSRKAQVDFIMIGPGGVFIVDAKQWRDVHIAADHVYRDQDDVTDDFAPSLTSQTRPGRCSPISASRPARCTPTPCSPTSVRLSRSTCTG